MLIAFCANQFASSNIFVSSEKLNFKILKFLQFSAVLKFD